MVYIIFLCLTIPMLLMLPLLEIKSRCIVGFLLLGTVTALSAYEINTIVYPMTGLSARSFSELVPPMTEELLKAIPVLLYAVLLDDRRNRVLPIAMAVGVGFAILENSMILIDNVGGSNRTVGHGKRLLSQPDARTVHRGGGNRNHIR